MPNLRVQAPVLGLFAKWPAPGTVKTRLAQATSAAWAARVAEAFLGDTLERLAALPVRRVLAYAPAGMEAEFAGLVRGAFETVPQSAGDLGQRLSAFIGQQLRAGADAVVVVGADSPTLPVALVEQAFRELDDADLVLGPTTDGGYYLVGCGRRVPPIFAGIDWSTNRVLGQTVARLTDPAWRLALLPPWSDVDTVEDWAVLCGHLAALRRAGLDPGVPRTEALARGLSSC
jgi:rSAM/selenodomain-associated transferase 1